MNPNAAISASLAVQTAEVQTLTATLEAALKALDLREIDGLPIVQWMAIQRKKELERVLIGMEDRDPGTAAMIQALIDSIQKPPAV